MLVFSLIFIGVFSRIIPHLPNFTPVGAIALFSGAYLKRKVSILIPLLILMISDILIGVYDPIVALFNVSAFVLISLLGVILKKKKTITRILGYSLLSSFIHYIISNFGVWFAGWYPKNIQGLFICYIMGLPFLKNFALSTILYSVIFFGICELVNFLVKNRKLKEILLKTI